VAVSCEHGDEPSSSGATQLEWECKGLKMAVFWSGASCCFGGTPKPRHV
jgi:hypothetical protein